MQQETLCLIYKILQYFISITIKELQIWKAKMSIAESRGREAMLIYLLLFSKVDTQLSRYCHCILVKKKIHGYITNDVATDYNLAYIFPDIFSFLVYVFI